MNQSRSEADQLIKEARADAARVEKEAMAKSENIVPEITKKLRADMEAERLEIMTRTQAEMKAEKEKVTKQLEQRVAEGQLKIDSKFKGMEEEKLAELDSLRQAEMDKFIVRRKCLVDDLTVALSEEIASKLEEWSEKSDGMEVKLEKDIHHLVREIVFKKDEEEPKKRARATG